MYKPKVFLSHSKKDISFINQIDLIFRQCHIDTWLDDIDIPHGSNWLDEIFKEGIAKCDIIFVYITENSIKSQMVTKEIDAALIAQLRNHDIKLILYASQEELRSQLRLDLQSLQIPILNNQTLSTLLPVIISNILNHFYNSICSKIIKEKDLEISNLALTLESVKNETNNLSIFDKEFEFIYLKLDKEIEVEILYQMLHNSPKEDKINLLLVVQKIYDCQGEVNFLRIKTIILNYIKQTNNLALSSEELDDIKIEIKEDIIKVLLISGFLKRNFNPKQHSIGDDRLQNRINEISAYFHRYEIYTISEKFDKFIMWLEYNHKSKLEL
jgi:hypothetical protein